VGVVGSGLIARDPFDKAGWSGSSARVFTGLQQRGRLHRAFGVEVPAWKRWFYQLRNFRFRRTLWRELFYLDVGYRAALTHEVHKALRPDDFAADFLQLGAMYDVACLLAGRARCYSYNDGNFAEFQRSPYFPAGVPARSIERVLEYERTAQQGCTRAFVMSEYLRQSFLRDYGLRPEQVVTIGAGINLDTIPEPVPDRRYDTREVLFIGVEFQRKGGEELLRAFRGVVARYPDAVLHIVGPRQLTIPPELERGVQYHGFLNKSDPAQRARLEDLFRRACLFAMPTRYEPFGLAPLEAMVHEIPALVTNRWAMPEMVTPGVNGDLVEVNNSADLEAKLLALLADPDALRRMGAAGRARVLEYYTWDKVLDRLLAALVPRT
jgi:glycosyltransferase involved in cell wall biosynthesis